MHQLIIGNLAADVYDRLARGEIDLHPVHTLEPLQGTSHAARSDIAHHSVHLENHRPLSVLGGTLSHHPRLRTLEQLPKHDAHLDLAYPCSLSASWVSSARKSGWATAMSSRARWR